MPPAAIALARRLRNGNAGLEALEPSWEAAQAKAGRYDAEIILQRVRAASRLAAADRKSGAVDRDGVVLKADEPPLALAACLLRTDVRARTGGLTVLDFGGALGSTYRQCAGFLSVIAPLRWHVVELAGLVACGRAEFETEALRFFSTMAEAAAAAPPDVILFSSVLQYLDDPYDVLAQASRLAPQAIVIDRTPVAEIAEDAFTIQSVPKDIFPARLPFRIFGEGRFASRLAPDYRQVVAFQALDADRWAGSLRVRHRGILFERANVSAKPMSDPSMEARDGV